MEALNSTLRRQLENTIVAARDLAEDGARAALERLAVGNTDAFAHLSPEQRQLRVTLRAVGRQLGGVRDARTGTQDCATLVQACAYEHWHRMLFARFLAENHLLIHETEKVAVTLDECDELAKEAGTDRWTLAGRYAARMLPQIFRPDDPLLRVTFAPEHKQALEKLVADLPAEVFAADDSLGWCYQFWQSKRKKEVNESEEKITGATLPAVTQLFTEDYMVLFLLHNTLGAWWAGKRTTGVPPVMDVHGQDARDTTEDDCRKAVALPGYEFTYLRFIRTTGVPPVPETHGQDARGTTCIPPVQIKHGAHLPHWTVEGAIYAICFRLADSLPAHVVAEIQAEREAIENRLRTENRKPTDQELQRLRELKSDHIEKYLNAGHGACYLNKPEVGQIVADALAHFDGERYRLHTWSIMPNHVHVIVEPLAGHSLPSILHSWKSFTAKKANDVLGRTGEFWAVEYYDHLIRDERDYQNQFAYVLNNPAKAGLENRTTGVPPVCEEQPHGQDARGTWVPAAGTFSGWPKTAKELKVLDPCCGSGHFLVGAFGLLVRMRMAEEGLDARAACDGVLRVNLFGLELDARCTQIAAFALALAAWKFPGAGGARDLPAMNIACSGLAPNATQEEWLSLARRVNAKQKRHVPADLIENGLVNLYNLFKDAPTLGSLINPKQLGSVVSADYDTLLPYLEEAFAAEVGDVEAHERAVAAQGMVKAAELLAGEYTLVVTNVPYLGRGKQCNTLKEHCDEFYPDGKADLATAFVQRCVKLCAFGSTTAFVAPQNWLFLPGFARFRKQILQELEFNVVVRLGANAFQDMNFWAATTALTAISACQAPASHVIFGVDASLSKDRSYKDEVLKTATSGEVISFVRQSTQLQNPDSRISLEAPSTHQLLGSFAITPQGMKTGDDPRFRRNWWEMPMCSGRWQFLHGAPDRTQFVDGGSYAIDYDDGKTEFARPQGQSVWGKQGFVIKLMGGVTAARYSGAIFDSNVTAVVPANEGHLAALWCYVSSPSFQQALRSIEQSVKVNNATVSKIPFDLAHWQKVAAETGCPGRC